MYVGKYGLIEGDEVKGMVRMTMNTVFYTRNRIGLARFLDGKQQSLETSICSTVKNDSMLNKYRAWQTQYRV